MIKKILLTIIILPILLFLGWIWLMYSMMTYEVLDYKSASLIEKGESEELMWRGQTYQYEDFDFWVEWNTYDNKRIYKPPYKLCVRVKEVGSKIKRISISDIKISSNKAKVYRLSDPNPLDIFPYNANSPLYKLDPAFDFDFHNDEDILLELNINILTKERAKTIKFRDVFKPIEFNRSAPIV